MKDPLEAIDLQRSVRRGIAHISRSVDRNRQCRPYFRFNLTQPPVWAQHEGPDNPHTVGRFLHALDVCTPIIGSPDDRSLVSGLRKQLLTSCEVSDGFGWDDTGHPRLAYMHHQREVLLGLIAIWNFYQDGEARRCGRALVAAIDRNSRELGAYPGRHLGSKGWQDPDRKPTSTVGRLIDALISFTRTFGDPLGIELAQMFARKVLTTSFTEEGVLKRGAGEHIHSITGTVKSLVELGLISGQREYIERARAIFDIGLSPYRTRTGWVKENAEPTYGRGEANCTADLIEAACLIGAAGHPGYFEDVEQLLRNHLLASQLDNLDWLVENQGMINTENRAYNQLREMAKGAFCFAEPNGFHSYNSDLTGAALQGIAAAWRHIATYRNKNQLYVNLLFSHDHKAARIVSFIPRKGRLMIDVKDTIDLYVRVPPWVDRKSLCVTIDGASVNVVMAGNYLNVGKRAVGSCVSMSFAQPEFATQEHALGYEQPYRVEWIGSTVAAMSGGREPMPLYPDLVCN